MPFYRDRIYPHLVRKLGDPPPIREIRGRIVPLAQGKVLEIGVGPGVNFVYYDAARVTKVYALEPNPGMILIPGRRQALLHEKWVPLATILAADQASPYYNEKNKAGSLYNEGWALTHMLYFRAEYRPKFSQLLRSISQGEESAEALLNVYGRPVKQIEKDLQAYMRGSSFQGALVAAKLEKASAEIPAESMADFDVGLMFADLMYRRGKEAAQQAALERLAQQDPKRPEPYRGLGYLALRTGRREEATQEFGKAFECGDRDTKLLWNYGRLLERNHEKEAIRVLSELLSQDAERTDVRLELAETQLRTNQAMAALDTIKAIHTVTPADAPRLYATQLTEGFLVHLQQRAQLLVERRFGHHRPAIAQRECETIQHPLLTIHLDSAQVSPVHLRLLARRCFEPSYRDAVCRFALRLQPVFQNRITPEITASQQLPQQHLRVPHARLHSLFQVRFEPIQLARRCRSWSVRRCAFRLDQVLANGFPVVPGQPTDRSDAHSLSFQLLDVLHVFPP